MCVVLYLGVFNSVHLLIPPPLMVSEQLLFFFLQHNNLITDILLLQSVFNVLGETLARLQQDEEAERWYQAALSAQPDHVPAHITYGKLLAKNVGTYQIF